jgi:hypothetical protein
VVALVVAGGGRRVVGVTFGVADALTLGNGAGKLVESAAGSCASAASSGEDVRNTGSRATEASTMLVAVAAHHPAIGAHREDRTRTSSHLPLWCTPWR